MQTGIGWAALAVFSYIAAVIGISAWKSRSATLDDYFIGSRRSLWWMITLGMISDSISGVTYVSVPGSYLTQSYSYLQLIFGHFFGYLIIAFVLLPIYYRRKMVSIYSYLRDRHGPVAEKTGAFFFVLSRLFGSSARLYVATRILHSVFLAPLGVPATISFIGVIALILLYTVRGGIKSLVWTDAFQSLFLVLGISVVFVTLFRDLFDPVSVLQAGKIVVTDPLSSNFFWKTFIGGMFITVAMNGLDQSIMQKNLSCPDLWSAQKNLSLFGFVLVAVNFIFVGLGGLVAASYESHGWTLPLQASGAPALDRLLPDLVLGHYPGWTTIFLLLGLTAATLSSVDSVLPAISSSIQLDLLGEHLRKRIPVRAIHAMVAVAILGVILAIEAVQVQSLVHIVLKYTAYVSGPLLGMFGIGIFTRKSYVDRAMPICAVLSIGTVALLDRYSPRWFGGYALGYELILINGVLFALLAALFSVRSGGSRKPVAATGSSFLP